MMPNLRFWLVNIKCQNFILWFQWWIKMSRNFLLGEVKRGYKSNDQIEKCQKMNQIKCKNVRKWTGWLWRAFQNLKIPDFALTFWYSYNKIHISWVFSDIFSKDFLRSDQFSDIFYIRNEIFWHSYVNQLLAQILTAISSIILKLLLR